MCKKNQPYGLNVLRGKRTRCVLAVYRKFIRSFGLFLMTTFGSVKLVVGTVVGGGRVAGTGRPTKISQQILAIIERQMQMDDETTAVQLQRVLVLEGHPLSLKTILRSRTKLGWTFRGSAYCQLIRVANKAKRLEWCRKFTEEAANDGFTDVLWTDKSSIQMEAHRWYCCRKTGTQPRPKPR